MSQEMGFCEKHHIMVYDFCLICELEIKDIESTKMPGVPVPSDFINKELEIIHISIHGPYRYRCENPDGNACNFDDHEFEHITETEERE